VLLAVVAGAGVTATVVRRRSGGGSMQVRRDGGYVSVRGVTVNRPVDDVAGLWQDQGLLERVLDRPVGLERIEAHRWRCAVSDPAGHGAKWMVTVEVENPGRWLRWWVEDGPVACDGRLDLAAAPGDRGTELRVQMHYPAWGRLRRMVAKLGGAEPDQVLRTVLRRAKSVIECGEVVSAEHDPSGRGPLAERVTDGVRELLAAGGRP
jgi:uncharacterized membrane protein